MSAYNGSYLSNTSADWGNSQVKYTAQNIDHLADKAKFGLEMLDSTLHSFGSVRKEIVDASNAQHPITREGLRSYAYRIEALENQLREATSRVKTTLTEIDLATDKIQHKSGW